MKTLIFLFLCLFCLSSLYPQQAVKARSSQGYVNITKDPPKPPYLEIVSGSLRFTDADGNQMIDANEGTKIRFQLRNSGMGPGLNLSVQVSEINAAKGLYFGSSTSIGTLQPNNTLSVEIAVTGNMNTADGKAVFSIAIAEANGFGTDPVVIEVPTRAFQAPLVKVVDEKVSSQSGTTIQKNKPFNVQVLVQNIGQGRADNITITLPVPVNMFCLSDNAVVLIPQLLPGESRLIEYMLIANNNYSLSDIKLDFQLKEKLNRYAENRNIVVAMNQQVSSEKLIVTGISLEQKQIQIGSLSSAVDKNIPAQPYKNPNRIALVIGNENYSGNLNAEVNVVYARNDAQVFGQYIRNLLGVEERNLFMAVDATAGEMSRIIDQVSTLLEKIGPDAELIFYYAGHGFPDEVSRIPYLIPVDVDGSNLSKAIKLSDIYEKFGSSGAKRVTIFLDACFSGSGRNQGLLVARSVRVTPRTESLTGNLVVFAASSGEQPSLPYNKEQHGIFTYFLLKKLQESKGLINYAELSDYVKKNVSIESVRTNGKEQDPEVNASPAVSDIWKSWKIAE